jgi:hypothetical protein
VLGDLGRPRPELLGEVDCNHLDALTAGRPFGDRRRDERCSNGCPSGRPFGDDVGDNLAVVTV